MHVQLGYLLLDAVGSGLCGQGRDLVLQLLRLDVFAVGSSVPYGPRGVEAIVAVFRQFVRGTVGDAIGYDTGLRLLQRPVVLACVVLKDKLGNSSAFF